MATKKKPPAKKKLVIQDGQHRTDFSAIGQSLVHKYLAESTHEERSEKSRQAAASRWEGKESERDQFMRKIARRPRPNRMVKDRCPCGKYSRWLADKRGHKCGPPPETTKRGKPHK